MLATPGEAAVATYRRLLDAALRDFDGAPGLGAARGDLARRTPGVPQPHPGRRRPRRDRPASSTCTSPTSPTTTATSTSAATARRYVVHDPEGLVELRHEDEEELARGRAEAVEQIAARRQTAAWLVNRAIARGDEPEAVAFHLQFGVNPLVRLLRIEHCPARHDFGLRYLDTDLPPGYAARVSALLPGPGLADRARATFAWQDELLAELDRS